MILDGHTHVFPEEVCRHREDFFSDEPAFRLLYDSPKAKLVGPEEMVAAMDEAGVTAAVVMGFPWRREALWRRQHEVILRGHAPLSPDPHRVLRGAHPGARRRPGGGALPGRRLPGRGRTGLV